MVNALATDANEAKRFEVRLSAEDARIVSSRMIDSGFTKQSDYLRACIMSGNFHHQEHLSELIGLIGVETGKLRHAIEQAADPMLKLTIDEKIRDLSYLMAKAVEALHFG